MDFEDKKLLRKIYVGCSLTQASEEYKKLIEDFKNELRPFASILDFVGLTKGTPKDVFEWDTNCVKTCDLFIADCTYPSIGLGYELGVAIEMKKRILAIAQKDAIVTRLVLGITSPNFEFVRYKDISEIIPKAKELL